VAKSGIESAADVLKARIGLTDARIGEIEKDIGALEDERETPKHLVTVLGEALDALGGSTEATAPAARAPRQPPGSIEKAIIAKLGAGDLTEEQIITATGFNPGSVRQALKRLRKQGKIIILLNDAYSLPAQAAAQYFALAVAFSVLALIGAFFMLDDGECSGNRPKIVPFHQGMTLCPGQSTVIIMGVPNQNGDARSAPAKDNGGI